MGFKDFITEGKMPEFVKTPEFKKNVIDRFAELTKGETITIDHGGFRLTYKVKIENLKDEKPTVMPVKSKTLKPIKKSGQILGSEGFMKLNKLINKHIMGMQTLNAFIFTTAKKAGVKESEVLKWVS